jgi:hypothetical protein
MSHVSLKMTINLMTFIKKCKKKFSQNVLEMVNRFLNSEICSLSQVSNYRSCNILNT